MTDALLIEFGEIQTKTRTLTATRAEHIFKNSSRQAPANAFFYGHSHLIIYHRSQC